MKADRRQIDPFDPLWIRPVVALAQDAASSIDTRPVSRSSQLCQPSTLYYPILGATRRARFLPLVARRFAGKANPMRQAKTIFAAVFVTVLLWVPGGLFAQSKSSLTGVSAPISKSLAERRQAIVQVVPLPGKAPVLGGGSGQGVVDLGRVSYTSDRHGAVTIERHGSYFTISTEFGLKLDSPDSLAIGNATISAYLIDPDAYCSYYLDGILLNQIPQVISVRQPYQMISEHKLEIRVSKNAPAGPLHSAIGWVVMPPEE